jgi:glyoxylase-like metal-dependent hydrolase (beta-lactamase superfamily II)
MTPTSGPLVARRRFLVQVGRGALGVAVFGLSACSGSDGGTAQATGSQAEPGSSTPTDTRTDTPTDTAAASDTATADPALAWSRVDLGFVAAYVLVRGREAAVVDTGVGGSAAEIGAVLQAAGPGWAGVRHVVLTHKHPDHAGSIGDVLERATQATAYAGEADLGEITASRRLRAVADGDDVFGLQIVASPGHTRGHVAVFDSDTGVLVAGDALNNTAGLAGSNPEFTEDGDAAASSVRKLALLRPRTILVGHGDPVDDDAAGALQRLAASLG